MPKRNFIERPRAYVSAVGAPPAVQFWDRIYRDRRYWLDWLVFQASIHHHDQWLARNRNPLPLEVRSAQLWQILLSAALGEKPNPFHQLHRDFVLAIPRAEQSAFLLAHLQGCLMLAGLDEREAQRCLVQFLHQRPGGIVINQIQLRPYVSGITAVDLQSGQPLVQPGALLPWANDLAGHDSCGISLTDPTRYARNELWYGGVDSTEKTVVELRTADVTENESIVPEALDERELCKLMLELHRFSKQVGLLQVSRSLTEAEHGIQSCRYSVDSEVPSRPESLTNETASVQLQAEVVRLWEGIFFGQDFAKKWSVLRGSASKLRQNLIPATGDEMLLNLSLETICQIDQRFWSYFCDLMLVHIREAKTLDSRYESTVLPAAIGEFFLAAGLTAKMLQFIRGLSATEQELVALWLIVGKHVLEGKSQLEAFIAATDSLFSEFCRNAG